MRQPGTGERAIRPGHSAGGTTGPGQVPDKTPEGRLPPGQHIPASWPVLHYGRVPVFHPGSWDLRVFGATENGRDQRWGWEEFGALPRCLVNADFHCVTKFSIPDIAWEGVPAAAVLQAVPPAATVTHVMVWADFGYSANVRIADFAADDTLLATRCNGAELTSEHGYPVRLVVPGLYGWKSVKWVRAAEYLTRDRRGFWEERGYHNTADPWREQRYSYQERPGEGPPL
ncbi:MAG TPA: molybdopterin-dependent oxidoreductase [Streptosporangiaceae bacterium]|nr:molybdopterin-dependent oxidoreductase [Streptosporangiaceae bacterium]